jgi:hypothetical protein
MICVTAATPERLFFLRVAHRARRVISEGEVVVFKPLSDGTHELVARIAPPEKWNSFVN